MSRVGKVGILLLDFPFSTRSSPGLREVGSDFQGVWETMENLLLVFLVFHSPSFPQSLLSFSSCAPSPAKAGKQFLLLLLHPSGNGRVTGCSFFPGQLLHCQILLQVPRHIRELTQNLPRRGVPAIDSSLFALGVGHYFW